MWDAIENHIQSVTKTAFRVGDRSAPGVRRSVSGGSINGAYEVSDGQQRYFVKLNQASKIGMFEAEALGLQALAASCSIRIPQVVGWGTADSHSYIILEWIDLKRNSGSSSALGWTEMGRQLARLHRTASPCSQRFGWDQNNTIGSTPQPNPWMQDWAEFFAEFRIGYQIQLAQRKGIGFLHTEKLLAAIPDLLGHCPAPSLVHGDLWSGNAGFSATGEPVMFDPAVYWGDREVDIAMTELFGGFPSSFYEGYQSVWPLDGGYKKRKVLYNLYHILNHFNLFDSGGYRAQAEQMMAQILH
jgi:fructosamine-3-kinase